MTARSTISRSRSRSSCLRAVALSSSTRSALNMPSTSPRYWPTGIVDIALPSAMAPMMRVACTNGRITRRRNCPSDSISAAASMVTATKVMTSSRTASARRWRMLSSMLSSIRSRNWVMDAISGT